MLVAPLIVKSNIKIPMFGRFDFFDISINNVDLPIVGSQILGLSKEIFYGKNGLALKSRNGP